MLSPPSHRAIFPRLLLATLFIITTGAATSGEREDARVRNAMRVLSDIQSIPESSIPDKLLDEAHAIAIVPDTIKIGFGIGGRGGRGVLAVKNADGRWSHPSFVRLGGGSIGFQIGVQSADVVLVFRNNRSLESIVNGKLTLGADVGIAAGPVGRNAAAATDGQFKAEIWSWSRARGLFAGVALDGAVLSIDKTSNREVYGRDTTVRMIFENRPQRTPSGTVESFREQLDMATAAARSVRGTAATQPSSAPVFEPPATAGTTASEIPVFEPVEDNGGNPVQVESLSEVD